MLLYICNYVIIFLAKNIEKEREALWFSVEDVYNTWTSSSSSLNTTGNLHITLAKQGEDKCLLQSVYTKCYNKKWFKLNASAFETQ